MKRTSVLVVVLLMFLSINLFAQSPRTDIASKVLALHLAVSYNQTTNLIFPYAIKSVDKGSKDLLVQKAKGVENVLQVKAAKIDFDVTNLTVITADGQLYSFLMAYQERPDMLNIELAKLAPGSPEIIFSQKDDNEAVRDDLSAQVAVKKPFLRKIKDENYNVALRMVGLYIENDMLYFQIELENSSNIGYDIDQLRFFVKDKKKTKRTASQEIELVPLSFTGNSKVIRRESKQIVVATLQKLTIPDKKYLSIELQEKGGGRHLSLKIQNSHLVNARLL